MAILRSRSVVYSEHARLLLEFKGEETASSQLGRVNPGCHEQKTKIPRLPEQHCIITFPELVTTEEQLHILF